jgi:apolipoprotein N-acyltransferase
MLSGPLAASALMLTVIQPPFSFAALAWIALVPFVLVCSPAAKPKPLALAAYLVSLAYWLANIYWVFPVTIAGWAAYCLYQALLWPILALALRYCRTKKIPLLLAVPVLFVGAERLQGLFLGGFFWRFLAHSQYQNIALIQIADIFGAAGVSFLIALINGFLAELVLAWRQKTILTSRIFLKTALVFSALIGTFLYGYWRIGQSKKYVHQGPLIASLQSNTPQSVKRTFDKSEDIFDQLLIDSNAAANAGARLIVWPETMVQAILNTDTWARLDPTGENQLFDEDKHFHRKLQEHAKDTAFVLVGAYGGRLHRKPDDTPYLGRYNSAFLYTPDGRQAPQSYDKIHLVPFGEVIPFRRSLPALYNFLMKFTPYNYDYSLEYGSEFTAFEMTAGPGSGPAAPQTYRFSVMICYEDTIPKIARTFALDPQGNKRIHWLLNISNDGWFVRFNDDKVPGPQVHASTELAQHAAICAFRAVENRLAIVRSVNTGISCIIDTNGRIRDGFVAGNLPKKAMARKAVAGWFVDILPIDNRVTFFSRYGQWLDSSCALCLVLLIIAAAFEALTADRRRSIRSSRKSK